jgi:hypothetical protein
MAGANKQVRAARELESSGEFSRAIDAFVALSFFLKKNCPKRRFF